jgi:hypothetical protein
MKRLILLLAAIFTISLANAQIKSSVDERFELTSIVFRLAGAPEYSMCSIPSYAKDIDDYFAPYKEHELIPFLQELRNRTGVSYNAVSSATPYLEIKNGEVGMIAGYTPDIMPEVDYRWTAKDFQKFVNFLNDFYQASQFHKFYSEHMDMYKKITDKLDEVLATINLDWCQSFFGHTQDSILILASPTNGPSNYAFDIPNNKDVVATILGIGSFTSDGQVYFSPLYTTIIVHEIFHHYSKDLFLTSWDKVKDAMDIIYPYVAEDMKANAYGDAKTVFGEWFNNLCMLMYFRENPIHGVTQDELINMYELTGYIWMERACEFMEDFHANRDKYHTINDYMPNIVAFVNDTAEHMDDVVKEFEAKYTYPEVVGAFPASGSTVAFDDADNIEFMFSEPMRGDRGLGGRFEDMPTLPVLFDKVFWKDDKTIVIPIDKSKIKNGTTYKLGLYPATSAKGRVMQQPYEHVITISEP